MMDTTETGTDAGESTLLEQAEADQSAAEETLELTEEVSEDEPAAEEPKEDTKDDGKREPLSPEEYQKRHENINNALRQERSEKREMRSELETLKAQIAELRETQPQQFQQFTLDQRLANFEGVDWQAWQQNNPQQALQRWNEYQALLGQREQAQQQTQQQQQQRQQQLQQQRLQEFVQTVGQSEQAFRETKPDYDAAVEYLKADLTREANGQGYFGEHADAYAQHKLYEVGARVHQSGLDLAEFAYNQAMQRGYAPKTADLAPLQAGAEAAKSISSLGGKASNEGGSMEETMANLDGAAARTFWRKVKANA